VVTRHFKDKFKIPANFKGKFTIPGKCETDRANSDSGLNSQPHH